MSKKEIISHLYHQDDEWHIQTNEEHCQGVAVLAARFTSEFGMSNWGELLGLLHDRGKESNAFQTYIKYNSGYDCSEKCNEDHTHSLTGAILAHRQPEDQLFWLSNAIAGHHGGLYNLDELEVKLEKTIPKEISQELPSISLPLPKFRLIPSDSSHISRMLFSCLIDADWLDTEKFMSPNRSETRKGFKTIATLEENLQSYCNKLSHLPQTPLNLLRNEIQKRCKIAANIEPGFFELTVPTGGGKTIASIIWAINHAIKYDKKRIIIAIPYTSIIVQTAATLKQIFGEENVIEHHSALDESEENEKSLLACENWDAPIIVTTNVQLFESMFSNRRSSCRKLHSIVNSVVILDEVQTLPMDFLQPIVDAMKTYNKLFGTSFLFCTASQPTLDGRHRGHNNSEFIGIDRSQIKSIIPNEMNLHEKLRRVEITVSETNYDYDTLAETLVKNRRVLCVVNTRNHAFQLYNSLLKKDNLTTYHLSRSMCAAHILKTIEDIKIALSDPSKNICVISTQLIEAGVDIDFPVVYRQLTGLDSILQAAGRCNREGKEKKGKTIVFNFLNNRDATSLRMATDTMLDMLAIHGSEDWLSPATMRLYYSRLYARTPYFDKEGISIMQDNFKNCQFEEISKKFRLIDESGKNIIVNFGNADKLIEKLRQYGPSRSLSRQLGRYSVNIPMRIFKEFEKAGLLEEPFPGFFYIPLKDQYNPLTGLKLENEYIEQTFVI